MAKATIKLTKKTLTPAAENLQKVLNLLEDDEKTPLELITKGMSLSDMKSKVMEAGGLVEVEDMKELEADTIEVLKKLKVKLPENSDKKSDEWTWEEISKMKRTELEKLCKDNDLVTTVDDYDADQTPDFRKDVADEMGLEYPEDTKEEPEGEPEEAVTPVVQLKTKELIKLTQETKKLQELKDIVTGQKLLSDVEPDDFSGLQGARKIKVAMLSSLGYVKPEEKAKDTKTEPVKKVKGVIATIISCIEKGPIKKEKILEVLIKEFPEREEKAMKNTISVQIPARIKKEKNDSLFKNENNEWAFAKASEKTAKTEK